MDGVTLPTGSGVGRIDYRFDLRDEYVEFMKKCVPVDLKGLKIVVDCAEGASYYTSVRTLEDLGGESDPDPHHTGWNKHQCQLRIHTYG